MTYKNERTITIGAVSAILRTSGRTHPTVTASKRSNTTAHGPHSMTDADAATLAEQRRAWIYRKLTHLTEPTPTNPLKDLATGEAFPLLGHPHRPRIAPDASQDQPLTPVKNASEGIWLHLRHNTTLNQDKAQRTLINFYTKTGDE